ncbi:hypothetical protein P60_gp15 [Synechococcus phage P60]|uniref:Glutaredoxin domain-containing protein n=1 Tax=Synechococcus phage P60 TaxID=2905923 RepID=Q8W710_9CAUD|nr:hypothetical protein P60_gp15 [Synechococcus phage P60]AAL73267.1 hypothetical protein P60_gp15 [Synechococcus phage P60]
MATFKLTLFTKRDCGPCKRVKNYLRTHNYLDKVNILEKENHPALVSAFDLDVYPTLVVSNGTQMIRKYEGSNLVLINLPDEIYEASL